MKRPLCCVCAAFVVIVFLYLEWNPAPDIIHDNADGSRVTLHGEVYQKEQQGSMLVLYLRRIRNSDTVGKVMCYVELDDLAEEARLGSTVVVEGEVSYLKRARNPGGFDAEGYYQILGIDFRLYNTKVLAVSSRYSLYHETLYQIRCYFEDIFDRVLSVKDASVMKAMILGGKSGLDAEIRQLFQRSGIAHIFAISGLHITLLGMGLYKLLRKTCIPQVFCALTAIFVMTAYGNMVGMSSSAYRAVFMFAMRLVAVMLRRTYDMLTALALAAVLILVEQPLYLYHAGFLLSFGAVLGISCFGGIMKSADSNAKRKLKGGAIKKSFQGICLSLCASFNIFIVHFPIMLCVYFTFPVYSFLLNLLVIPAMTVVMASGLLCLCFGSLPAAIGIGMAKYVGGLCHILICAFEWLCGISMKLPYAEWIVGRPENWRICAYIVVILFLYTAHCYAAHFSRGRSCGKRGIWIGIPLNIKYMIVLAAVVLVSDSSIDGASMTFLDVGQGDCIWIESAGGEHFLIDGGSTSENKVGQYTIVPYLKYMGVSRLDAVFLTHLDKDHISGVLEMLDGSTGVGDGIQIGRICIPCAAIEDEAYEKLVTLCKLENIPLYKMKSGDKVTAHGLCFEVLHPQEGYEASSRNASSLVMKLEIVGHTGRGKSGKVAVLLTGDVEADGEYAAAEILADREGFTGIDIYKASHHGSRYANTAELISVTAPQLGIISCGADNSYGHPHIETIERLRQAGSDIMITKDTGAIMIQIKKGNYTVTPYKRSRS
ncbi:MAG: DNA internalization-related competence protein ComEC/Rec2 [Lachnospiraceae bacterium]|nr:DNA internalization-related competence protein ComEC/Rec2 [Lachnospiraceae bacterium]